MAPVGQWAEHWPQRMQGDSESRISPAGAMRVLMPRSRNDSAQTFWVAWQTWMQRPHFTHLVKSTMIDPVEQSRGRSRT